MSGRSAPRSPGGAEPSPRDSGTAAALPREPNERPGPRAIALDGPVASGKSVVGRRLADALGYLYFDTGALYRALTVLALEAGVRADDADGLARIARDRRIEIGARPGAAIGYAVLAEGRDITAALRSPSVDATVSPVSSHAAVRQLLLDQQRRVAAEQRVVMTGRDIGTLVLPTADLKLYLDASPAARARRRFRERLAMGDATSYEAVLSSLIARDAGDSSRAAGPLAIAGDAVVVNTDACDVDGVVQHLLALVGRWPDELTTRGGIAPCTPADRSAPRANDAP